MIARVILPSGRTVLYTGKQHGKMPLYIGLRAEPQRRDQGPNAEFIQRLFTTPLPKQWEEHPVQFHVSLPWWRRLFNR